MNFRIHIPTLTPKSMKPNLPCLLIALASATVAVAQPPGNRRPPPPMNPPMNQPPMMQPPPFFALLDTDHDGVLSEAEVKASSDVLAKADKNHDGEITPDELRPQKPNGKQKPDGKQPPNNDNKDKPPGPPPGKFPVPPVIAALDADHNGTISAEELEGATEALKKLDINQDGELSPDEMRPAGPPPREDGGPQGPPPPTEDGQLDGVE